MMATIKFLRLAAAAVFILIFFNLSFLRDQLSRVPSFISQPSLMVSEDAHKLPSADSFLSHFKAVTRIPNLSMREAKGSCNWPLSEKINWMFGNDKEWVMQDRKDADLSARRKEWHNFITNDLLPYSDYKHRFSGPGIAIVAGNKGTINRTKVLLRALTALGSQLPVEIHYWEQEIPDTLKQELKELFPNLYFNDLSSSTNIVHTSYNWLMINYQLKTAAVLNSRFAEVLLLDSDNIPIIDPSILFTSKAYLEYGTIFWPDIARTRPNNPIWAITNTNCRTDEYEAESGQLLVDKRRYFYHLQLAAWWNNKNFEYYQDILLGDKDLFRFAWHALKTQYGKPGKWITSVGTVNEGYYCGHTFAQHDDEGRVIFMHGGLVKGIPKEVVKWQRDVNGGLFQSWKRSEDDEKHEKIVDVSIKWDRGEYFSGKLVEEGKVWGCTDYYKVEARPLEELLVGFEGFFEGIGGYWMLDEEQR